MHGGQGLPRYIEDSHARASIGHTERHAAVAHHLKGTAMPLAIRIFTSMKGNRPVIQKPLKELSPFG
jgi:hypothetical protein